MDLTQSFLQQFPDEILGRYEFRETRNAASILRATNSQQLQELIAILQWLKLTPADVTGAGGNESELAARLNQRFRDAGWREGRHDTEITSVLKLMPYRPAGETKPRVAKSVVVNEGYKVDNVRARVALDGEWNARWKSRQRHRGLSSPL